jgi:hypothetical protein
MAKLIGNKPNQIPSNGDLGTAAFIDVEQLPVSNPTQDALDLKASIADPTFTGDITVGDGIYLGGTGAANYLDDYETGTWTVTITGSTTAGSHSSVYSLAWYIKTGALVTVGFIFEGFSGTGSGNMEISGLPFTPIYESVSAIQWNSGLDLPTGTNTAMARAYSGNSKMHVRCNNDGTGGYVYMPYPTAPSYVRGTITYRTS